jgi:DNA invertase Pin-like site-specific DNA recombinase
MRPSRTLHVYTRVSTVAQADKGTSLEFQLELGQKKAAELGFEVRHWNEGGRSSHHEEMSGRPVLFELFSAIKAGSVKHLWVYDQSRLSRNDQVASVIRYECNKQGVTLYTKDGQYDLANPQDKFLKQLLDAVAEFDNSTRAERTRMGKLRRVQAGQWHGGPPPFGYRITNKRLEIEPEEAKWVRKMFSLSLDGDSPAKIKATLDGNGVLARRGGLWTIGSIAALLKNEHYKGIYRFKDKRADEEIQVSCPSIVSAETWEGVQLAHYRNPQRVRQQAATKHFYLLRELMYCGHCGRPMAGRTNRSKGEAFYYCPNKERKWVQEGKSSTPWQRGTGCGFERSMNISRTDELVWRLVTDLHAKSSHLKEEVKKRLLEQQGIDNVASESERRKVAAKLKRLQKDAQTASEALGNLESQKLLGNIAEGVYKTARSRLEEARITTEQEILRLQQLAEGASQKRRWVNWLQQFGAELEASTSWTDQQRQAYLKGIVDRIDAYWAPGKGQHELKVQFSLPIVGDGLRWLDAKKKSEGYEIVDGTNQTTATLTQRQGN